MDIDQENIKRICFYHVSDFDGHCSAAIVRKKFPDAEMYYINYGYRFPWYKVNKETDVYMVDFSLPIDDMIELKNVCHNLIWCDHHNTALVEASNKNFVCDGQQLEEYAGCQLTWDCLFPGEKRPLIVNLLGWYDIWVHDKHEDILPFQSGLHLFGDTRMISPAAKKLWECLLNTDTELIEDIISQGRIVEKYHRNQYKMLESMSLAFRTFEGFDTAVINCPGLNSCVFEYIAKTKPEFQIAKLWIIYYRHAKGIWNISLFSDSNSDIHVGNIAKKYGGGGHLHAAGFQCQNLPFKI